MKSILNRNLSKITMIIIATMTTIIVHKVPSILLCYYLMLYIFTLSSIKEEKS
jgi:hypothetical protein